MKDKVDQARQTLKEAGYYVDNLWHISDVKEDHVLAEPFEDATDEEAMMVLRQAFNNNATYEQIWLSIKHAIEPFKPQP